MRFTKYLKNCFWLLVPVLLWNILFVDYLPKGYSPENFWNNVPPVVKWSENILRIFVLGVLPFFMIFSLKTKLQKIGFWIYSVGVLVYFLSWVVLMFYPEWSWSKSRIGFMAPAFTTIIWFVGIGLIGSKSFFNIPKMSMVYIIISFLFVVVHALHTYLAY